MFAGSCLLVTLLKCASANVGDMLKDRFGAWLSLHSAWRSGQVAAALGLIQNSEEAASVLQGEIPRGSVEAP